jgi:hypothetical protein
MQRHTHQTRNCRGFPPANCQRRHQVRELFDLEKKLLTFATSPTPSCIDTPPTLSTMGKVALQFSCPYCNKSFPKHHGLRQHLTKQESCSKKHSARLQLTSSMASLDHASPPTISARTPSPNPFEFELEHSNPGLGKDEPLIESPLSDDPPPQIQSQPTRHKVTIEDEDEPMDGTQVGSQFSEPNLLKLMHAYR